MGNERRILIAEDEAFSAMWLELELTRAGFSVLPPVASGEDAVETARRHRPDLLLMDIRLAGEMDGIDAAGEIRATYACDVVFMTGYSDPELRERANRLAPLSYITKPIRIAELKHTIATQ